MPHRFRFNLCILSHLIFYYSGGLHCMESNGLNPMESVCFQSETTHTVDTHLLYIYVRMGAQSRMQAVLLALHRHQLELGELVASMNLVA